MLDLAFDFALHLLCFATGTGNTISLELGSSILRVVSGHDLLLLLAIDSILSVIEHLSLDWVLKIMMTLGDVSLGNSSKKT